MRGEKRTDIDKRLRKWSLASLVSYETQETSVGEPRFGSGACLQSELDLVLSHLVWSRGGLLPDQWTKW